MPTQGRLLALVLSLSVLGVIPRSRAFAAFSGTDVLVPAVARASGLNQSSLHDPPDHQRLRDLPRERTGLLLRA